MSHMLSVSRLCRVELLIAVTFAGLIAVILVCTQAWRGWETDRATGEVVIGELGGDATGLEEAMSGAGVAIPRQAAEGWVALGDAMAAHERVVRYRRETLWAWHQGLVDPETLRDPDLKLAEAGLAGLLTTAASSPMTLDQSPTEGWARLGWALEQDSRRGRAEAEAVDLEGAVGRAPAVHREAFVTLLMRSEAAKRRLNGLPILEPGVRRATLEPALRTALAEAIAERQEDQASLARARVWSRLNKEAAAWAGVSGEVHALLEALDDLQTSARDAAKDFVETVRLDADRPMTAQEYRNRLDEVSEEEVELRAQAEAARRDKVLEAMSELEEAVRSSAAVALAQRLDALQGIDAGAAQGMVNESLTLLALFGDRVLQLYAATDVDAWAVLPRDGSEEGEASFEVRVHGRGEVHWNQGSMVGAYPVPAVRLVSGDRGGVWLERSGWGRCVLGTRAQVGGLLPDGRSAWRMHDLGITLPALRWGLDRSGGLRVVDRGRARLDAQELSSALTQSGLPGFVSVHSAELAMPGGEPWITLRLDAPGVSTSREVGEPLTLTPELLGDSDRLSRVLAEAAWAQMDAELRSMDWSAVDGGALSLLPASVRSGFEVDGAWVVRQPLPGVEVWGRTPTGLPVQVTLRPLGGVFEVATVACSPHALRSVAEARAGGLLGEGVDWDASETVSAIASVQSQAVDVAQDHAQPVHASLQNAAVALGVPSPSRSAVELALARGLVEAYDALGTMPGTAPTPAVWRSHARPHLERLMLHAWAYAQAQSLMAGLDQQAAAALTSDNARAAWTDDLVSALRPWTVELAAEDAPLVRHFQRAFKTVLSQAQNEWMQHHENPPPAPPSPRWQSGISDPSAEAAIDAIRAVVFDQMMSRSLPGNLSATGDREVDDEAAVQAVAQALIQAFLRELDRRVVQADDLAALEIYLSTRDKLMAHLSSTQETLLTPANNLAGAINNTLGQPGAGDALNQEQPPLRHLALRLIFGDGERPAMRWLLETDDLDIDLPNPATRLIRLLRQDAMHRVMHSGLPAWIVYRNDTPDHWPENYSQASAPDASISVQQITPLIIALAQTPLRDAQLAGLAITQGDTWARWAVGNALPASGQSNSGFTKHAVELLQEARPLRDTLPNEDLGDRQARPLSRILLDEMPPSLYIEPDRGFRLRLTGHIHELTAVVDAPKRFNHAFDIEALYHAPPPNELNGLIELDFQRNRALSTLSTITDTLQAVLAAIQDTNTPQAQRWTEALTLLQETRPYLSDEFNAETAQELRNFLDEWTEERTKALTEDTILGIPAGAIDTLRDAVEQVASVCESDETPEWWLETLPDLSGLPRLADDCRRILPLAQSLEHARETQALEQARHTLAADANAQALIQNARTQVRDGLMEQAWEARPPGFDDVVVQFATYLQELQEAAREIADLLHDTSDPRRHLYAPLENLVTSIEASLAASTRDELSGHIRDCRHAAETLFNAPYHDPVSDGAPPGTLGDTFPVAKQKVFGALSAIEDHFEQVNAWLDGTRQARDALRIRYERALQDLDRAERQARSAVQQVLDQAQQTQEQLRNLRDAVQQLRYTQPDQLPNQIQNITEAVEALPDSVPGKSEALEALTDLQAHASEITEYTHDFAEAVRQESRRRLQRIERAAERFRGQTRDIQTSAQSLGIALGNLQTKLADPNRWDELSQEDLDAVKDAYGELSGGLGNVSDALKTELEDRFDTSPLEAMQDLQEWRDELREAEDAYQKARAEAESLFAQVREAGEEVEEDLQNQWREAVDKANELEILWQRERAKVQELTERARRARNWCRDQADRFQRHVDDAEALVDQARALTDVSNARDLSDRLQRFAQDAGELSNAIGSTTTIWDDIDTAARAIRYADDLAQRGESIADALQDLPDAVRADLAAALVQPELSVSYDPGAGLQLRLDFGDLDNSATLGTLNDIRDASPEALNDWFSNAIKDNTEPWEALIDEQIEGQVQEAGEIVKYIRDTVEDAELRLEAGIRGLTSKLPERVNLFGLVMTAEYGPGLRVTLTYTPAPGSAVPAFEVAGLLEVKYDPDSDQRFPFQFRRSAHARFPTLRPAIEAYLAEHLPGGLTLTQDPAIRDRTLFLSLRYAPSGFPFPIDMTLTVDDAANIYLDVDADIDVAAVLNELRDAVLKQFEDEINRAIRDRLAEGELPGLGPLRLRDTRDAEGNPSAITVRMPRGQGYEEVGVTILAELVVTEAIRVPVDVLIGAESGVRVEIDPSVLASGLNVLLDSVLGSDSLFRIALASPPFNTDDGLRIDLRYQLNMPFLGAGLGGELSLSARGVRLGPGITLRIPGWYDAPPVSFGNMQATLELHERRVSIGASVTMSPGAATQNIARFDITGTISYDEPFTLSAEGSAVLFRAFPLGQVDLTLIPELGSFVSTVRTSPMIGSVFRLEGELRIETDVNRGMVLRGRPWNIGVQAETEVFSLVRQRIEGGLTWTQAGLLAIDTGLPLGSAAGEVSFDDHFSNLLLLFEAVLGADQTGGLAEIDVFVEVSSEVVHVEATCKILGVPIGVDFVVYSLADLTPWRIVEEVLKQFNLQLKAELGFTFSNRTGNDIEGGTEVRRVPNDGVDPSPDPEPTPEPIPAGVLRWAPAVKKDTITVPGSDGLLGFIGGRDPVTKDVYEFINGAGPLGLGATRAVYEQKWEVARYRGFMLAASAAGELRVHTQAGQRLWAGRTSKNPIRGGSPLTLLPVCFEGNLAVFWAYGGGQDAIAVLGDAVIPANRNHFTADIPGQIVRLNTDRTIGGTRLGNLLVDGIQERDRRIVLLIARLALAERHFRGHRLLEGDDPRIAWLQDIPGDKAERWLFLLDDNTVLLDRSPVGWSEKDQHITDARAGLTAFDRCPELPIETPRHGRYIARAVFTTFISEEDGTRGIALGQAPQSSDGRFILTLGTDTTHTLIAADWRDEDGMPRSPNAVEIIGLIAPGSDADPPDYVKPLQALLSECDPDHEAIVVVHHSAARQVDRYDVPEVVRIAAYVKLLNGEEGFALIDPALTGEGYWFKGVAAVRGYWRDRPSAAPAGIDTRLAETPETYLRLLATDAWDRLPSAGSRSVTGPGGSADVDPESTLDRWRADPSGALKP